MIDVLVPVEQEGTKAVVRTWLKQVGEKVELNDPLVELETDKVAMEVPAPAAGVLREILLHSDEDAVPGAVLGRIAPVLEMGELDEPALPKGLKVQPAARPSPAPKADRPAATPDRENRLSPSVKRAILQHDLDPARIEDGGGGGGIIALAVAHLRILADERLQPQSGVG